MAEKPRSENLEQEKNPEQVVNDAVSAVENRDAADPVISSFWARKSKEFFSAKENWEDIKNIGNLARFGIFTAVKTVWGLLKFTKGVIEGKMKFKEGYEIGKWIIDPENKKDKK